MSPASAPQANARRNGSGPSAHRRFLWIHERLGNHRRATSASLAQELGVSDRTIKRDIEHLRTYCGAVIVWEPSTKTYFYEKPCEHLPLLRLSVDEALALVLAGETFAAWRGSPLGRALNAAFAKIADIVGGAISLPADEVRQLLFQPEGGPETDTERRWLGAAVEAIRRRRELRLSYCKPAAARPETRVVQPLHLALLDHRWMLVAHDPAKRGLRNFLLARIRDATPTGRSFEPSADFDAAAYFRGSLGRFGGSTEHVVRIAFDAIVAPYIRERRWHPSQTIVEQPAGGIEVTLRLNNLVDVRRWVLACGRHARVLEPAELRQALREEVAAMSAGYAK